MSQEFDPFDPDEWGDKPGCSAFETALEMKSHGALAPDAVAVLEVHLGACDACRDHAARLGRVDASLVAVAAVPDARRLRGKMDDALKRTRRTPWALAGVGLAMLVLVQALFRLAGIQMIPLISALAIVLLTVATGGLGVYLRARRLRRLLAETDVIGAYRRWLEFNVKGGRRLLWFLLPLIGVNGLRMLGNLQRYGEGDRRAAVWGGLAFLAVVAYGFALFESWRGVRRMKAELKELH